jgi:hypothetical protein
MTSEGCDTGPSRSCRRSLPPSPGRPTGTTIRSMTPADTQQEHLLEHLREAGDEAVAFAELHAAGIAFPAAVSIRARTERIRHRARL